MKCPHDQSEMEVAGSRASNDGARIITNWMCPRCFYRNISFSNNPRHQPIMPSQEQRRPQDDYSRREQQAWTVYNPHKR